MLAVEREVAAKYELGNVVLYRTTSRTFSIAKESYAVVVAKDRIQLESPAGTSGEEVEVTVTFPDGRSAKAPQHYRWVPANAGDDHDHDGSGSAAP